MKKVEMPKMGDTMEEGKILRWIKKEGDPVKKGEMLAEVETDKVNIEIEAFASGTLRKILVSEGNSAPIGAAIALIGAADEPLSENTGGNGATKTPATREPGEHSPGNGQSVPAQVLSSTVAAQTRSPAAPIPGKEGRIFISPIARSIARRLSQSMQTAPHFYVTSVIDTNKLAALRQQINEYAATDPSPVKVSFNDLIVKAVARALVRIPQVNVSFAEDRILQKKQVHIGVAVALEQGLIVPVLRNADQLGILDIARATLRLAEAARESKLRPEDFSGGSFTVRKLGMFDVGSFTAVINPPEAAILAVGSIQPTPVVVDGQVVVRNRMKVTLSSDHRAIDGATAARFLQEVKRRLEEPFGLLL